MKVSGYYISGTDTGVGKTLVSAALLYALRERGYRAIGMKPVASGCRPSPQGLRNGDALALIAESASKLDYSIVNPYAYEPAIAPQLAARQSGQSIELGKILEAFEQIKAQAELTIVEGVGGWHVPLGPGLTTEDMAKSMQLPVILVVGMRLGCLNHALLTVDAIQRSGLELVGWVGNHIDPEMELMQENLESLQHLVDAPLLGTIPFLPNLVAEQASTYLDLKILE